MGRLTLVSGYPATSNAQESLATDPYSPYLSPREDL